MKPLRTGFGMKRWGVLSAVLALGFALLSMGAGFPSKVVLRPDTLHVGDPATLLLTLPGQEGISITWPDVSDGRLGDFTVLQVDTLRGREARKLGGPTLRLSLALYDTGRASTGEIRVIAGSDTQMIAEQVASVFTLLGDEEAEFRPLKAQVDLPITLSDMIRYLGPWLLGILAILLLVYLVRRYLLQHKKRVEAEAAPPIPPYEEAVAALRRLKKENPLARGDQKAYVSALVQIVKRLLERSHGDPVLEMTTGEVRRWVHQRQDLRFESNLLLQLLDSADGVKFARLALAQQMAETALKSVEAMVEAYRPREDEAVSEGSGREVDFPAASTPASDTAGKRASQSGGMS